MSSQAAHTRRWTRTDYYHMAEAGVFRHDKHLELIQGEIITMTPQRSRDAAVISIVEIELRRAFGDSHLIRVQMPLALDNDSEPESDLAVVTGVPRDYLTNHPRSALLVVEISDTTLKFDREDKSALYAQYHIPDY